MNRQELNTIIQKLTLKEKIALTSGSDFWHTASIKRLKIPAIMMADGPFGLRKQKEDADHMGINQSYPATCFPPLATLACSWDRELLKEIGEAIANECKDQQVAMILGPGINMKRSPLCGRNFEYFSEDPFLTSHLASVMVKAIEDNDIKSCVKHFALNNQETNRMISDSIVDKRALFEIYLSAFEFIVKQAKPTAIMTSYNKLNGTYTGEHPWLLNEILRKQWGFEGIVISDWGACNDKVASHQAGMDLVMPKNPKAFAKQLEKAIKNKKMALKDLDLIVARLLKVILNVNKTSIKVDYETHHQLARKAASSSFVLLKNNENKLPISPKKPWLIIGEMAKYPRYQGSGSSLINPTKLLSFLDVCNQENIQYQYFSGYDLQSDNLNQVSIEMALSNIDHYENVLVFVGLPETYESEGYDRSHMDLPLCHNQLINQLSAYRDDLIILLAAGAPVSMPWHHRVKAILHTYLAGQAGAQAIYDVLIGSINPSGKLAESYPFKIEDTPSYHSFGLHTKTAFYKESIFIGYRFYDTYDVEVLYPFGHGLSYTTFKYQDLLVSGDFPTLTLTCTITNIGNVFGHEIVQLYIKYDHEDVLRPKRELKGFVKVLLQPNQSETITFHTDARSFSIYDTSMDLWIIPDGIYTLQIGSSLQDIRLQQHVLKQDQVTLPPSINRNTYPQFSNKHAIINMDDATFAAYLGISLPPSRFRHADPFTLNSNLTQLSFTLVGRLMLKVAKKMAKDMMPSEPSTKQIDLMMEKGIVESPIRSLIAFSNGKFSLSIASMILLLANFERILFKREHKQ